MLLDCVLVLQGQMAHRQCSWKKARISFLCLRCAGSGAILSEVKAAGGRAAVVICFDHSSFIIQRLLKSHFRPCSCAATTLWGAVRDLVFIFFPHLLLADCLFKNNHLLFRKCLLPWRMTCINSVNSYQCPMVRPGLHCCAFKSTASFILVTYMK